MKLETNALSVKDKDGRSIATIERYEDGSAIVEVSSEIVTLEQWQELSQCVYEAIYRAVK